MNQGRHCEYEVAVIGGGSGGYAAARTAAAAGLKTALVDGAQELGGLCILRGCMPSKALLHAAEVLHLMRKTGHWGLRSTGIGFDWAQLMAWKQALIQQFADYRRTELGSGAFTLIRAQAQFNDGHTLSLSTGETLTARHFVVATGSMVAAPMLSSLQNTGYQTSDTALSLARLPRSLLVLGGGAVAVELAQFLARFAVKVTLVQRSQHILSGFDRDLAAELETVLRREGITLFTKTKLTGAWQEGGRKWIAFEQDGQIVRLATEEILFAQGRFPNTAHLRLDKAGVFTEHGRILTNTEMQTAAPHIYAAGDCTGPHEIVHLAIQQGEIAAHNIAHPNEKRSLDYRLITHIVFTEPQVASVGLSEKEAQAHETPYQAARYPFADHGKSIIMDTLDGFVKLLAHPATGEILGGGIVGPMGGELIHEIIAAMHKHMTVRELAAMPHYHPTLAEIWTYPAEELAAKIPPQ